MTKYRLTFKLSSFNKEASYVALSLHFPAAVDNVTISKNNYGAVTTALKGVE